MKKFLFILQFLLVIYAIFYIVNVDYSKLKNIFGIEQVFSIFILLLFHLVRAIRLRGIVRMYSCDFSLKDALFLYYIGLAFAIVTPGRVGEVYRIKLLNEKHIPYVEAWEIFILEKYTDLIALLSFFVFSIVMIVAPGFSAYLILLSTIIVSNIAIYLVFNISNKLSRKRVFINKENIASKIIEFFSRFFANADNTFNDGLLSPTRFANSIVRFMELRTLDTWLLFVLLNLKVSPLLLFPFGQYLISLYPLNSLISIAPSL